MRRVKSGIRPSSLIGSLTGYSGNTRVVLIMVIILTCVLQMEIIKLWSWNSPCLVQLMLPWQLEKSWRLTHHLCTKQRSIKHDAIHFFESLSWFSYLFHQDQLWMQAQVLCLTCCVFMEVWKVESGYICIKLFFNIFLSHTEFWKWHILPSIQPLLWLPEKCLLVSVA